MLPIYKETNFRDVKKFYLMLGTACNMHCRHCIQTPIKGNNFNLTSLDMDERVASLAENYIKFCVNYNLPPKNKPYYMYFWGGEPLLYWNFIKKYVVKMTEKYDMLRNRNIRFRMTTNGTLLTDEMIDFFNKYQVKVHFSYDAPWPFAVRDYVSDEVCEKVKRIHGHEIQCNYSAYNCDQMLALRCSSAKFPEAHVQVNLKMMRTFEDMPEDAYRYDLNKVRTAIRKIRIAFQMGDPYFRNWVLNRFLIPGKISRGYFVPDVGNERLLCVGLNGDVHLGFNIDIPVTTVDDSLNTVYKKIFDIKVGLLGHACKICRNRDICKAPLFDIHDESGNFVSCLPFYIKYYDIVREEMEKTKYLLTKEDVDWYHEQEKIMDEQVQAYLNEGKRYEKEHTRLPKDMMYMINS